MASLSPQAPGGSVKKKARAPRKQSNQMPAPGQSKIKYPQVHPPASRVHIRRVLSHTPCTVLTLMTCSFLAPPTNCHLLKSLKQIALCCRRVRRATALRTCVFFHCRVFHLTPLELAHMCTYPRQASDTSISLCPELIACV